MKEITLADIDPNTEVVFYYNRQKALKGAIPATIVFIFLFLFAALLVAGDDGTSANYRHNTMFILLGVGLYFGLILYKLIAIFDTRPQMIFSAAGISFYKSVKGKREPFLYRWPEISELKFVVETGKGILLTRDAYKVQFYHHTNRFMPISKRVSFMNLRCSDLPEIMYRYRLQYGNLQPYS